MYLFEKRVLYSKYMRLKGESLKYYWKQHSGLNSITYYIIVNVW